MDKVNDKLWHAFKHLAEQYPDDHGVRMTSDSGAMAHRRAATTTTSWPVTRCRQDSPWKRQQNVGSPPLTSSVVQSPILLVIEEFMRN